jgi:hypothetical protein
MPSSNLERKLSETENKLVDIVLSDTFLQLKQILRLDAVIIRKIILHKLVDMEK